MDGKAAVGRLLVLVVVGFGLIFIVVSHFLVLPQQTRPGRWGSIVVLNVDTNGARLLGVVKNDNGSDGRQEDVEYEDTGYGSNAVNVSTRIGAVVTGRGGGVEVELVETGEEGVGEIAGTILRRDENVDGVGPVEGLRPRVGENLLVPANSELDVSGDVPSEENGKSSVRIGSKSDELVEIVPTSSNENPARGSMSILNGRRTLPTSLTLMNSLLIQSVASSPSLKPRRSSARDRELLSAKLRIRNAPVTRNSPGLHASVFRNVSTFKRSYELMESMLKVYVYKEGEKPIFHQPKMRGIYASEGWFMKLMEGNKKFTVRDPRKAHLFYLPFSSQMLRNTLLGQNITSHKDLEDQLKSYVSLLAQKYRFWNRTNGSDHFLVGCHDWASRITRQHMGSCIRALCNSNVARGFKIGKDTSLPVTYIKSSADPQKDLGGKPPIERSVLAFFAGSMHGYLRPILLQYWENKEPDMKIFGPMPRDPDGKRMYREYMKSSKYCICARGYEVHTPRIVESVLYECVPVVISDNYVPPFFEVLDWESFVVFVEEKDVPNLRNILLSIPQERYLEMQLNVKMVQRHFLWHRQPVKYDLFHMILHSVWYNRVSQI